MSRCFRRTVISTRVHLSEANLSIRSCPDLRDGGLLQGFRMRTCSKRFRSQYRVWWTRVLVVRNWKCLRSVEVSNSDFSWASIPESRFEYGRHISNFLFVLNCEAIGREGGEAFSLSRYDERTCAQVAVADVDGTDLNVRHCQQDESIVLKLSPLIANETCNMICLVTKDRFEHCGRSSCCLYVHFDKEHVDIWHVETRVSFSDASRDTLSALDFVTFVVDQQIVSLPKLMYMYIFWYCCRVLLLGVFCVEWAVSKMRVYNGRLMLENPHHCHSLHQVFVWKSVKVLYKNAKRMQLNLFQSNGLSLNEDQHQSKHGGEAWSSRHFAYIDEQLTKGSVSMWWPGYHKTQDLRVLLTRWFCQYHFLLVHVLDNRHQDGLLSRSKIR